MEDEDEDDEGEEGEEEERDGDEAEEKAKFDNRLGCCCCLRRMARAVRCGRSKAEGGRRGRGETDREDG